MGSRIPMIISLLTSLFTDKSTEKKTMHLPSFSPRSRGVYPKKFAILCRRAMTYFELELEEEE